MLYKRKMRVFVCFGVFVFTCATLLHAEPPLFSDLVANTKVKPMEHDREWYEEKENFLTLAANNKFHDSLLILGRYAGVSSSTTWPSAKVQWKAPSSIREHEGLGLFSYTWEAHVIDGKSFETFSEVTMSVTPRNGTVFPVFGRLYEYLPAAKELQDTSVDAHLFPYAASSDFDYSRCILTRNPDPQDPWGGFMSFRLRLLTRNVEAQEETIYELSRVQLSKLSFQSPTESEPARANLELDVEYNLRMRERLPEDYDGYRGDWQSEELTISEGDVIEVPNHPLRFYVKEIVLPDPKHDPPIYGWVELLDYIDGETPPQEALKE